MSASKPGLIRRTFSWIWNLVTFIRTSLANILFLVLVLVIVVVLLPKEVKQMPQQTALRIAPSGFLVDQYSYVDPITQLLEQSRQQHAETLVRDVIKAIDAGATDTRITSLVMDLNYLLGGGISKLEEIGAALQRFKDSGKPIYALSDNFSHEQYFLASYADEIMMHPMGGVVLTGFSSYRNYFKSALDKLELNMHVFRVGEYKDAVEPYLRDSMSEASREHNSQWLNELWSTYTSDVEQHRQLTNGGINDYINRMDQHFAANNGDPAETALALQLVDQLASHDQQNQYLISKVGKDHDTGEYRAMDYEDYLPFLSDPAPHNNAKIGLLIAKGVILDGEQPEGSIGGDTLSKMIREAREDKNIKALVMRVDSGGGSAFASEVIRQELEITRQQGIPILVSMGSVAASGGYWIAMGADEVWATPTTITGSIGVFSAFPTVERSLAKIGISTDGVGTTDLAGSLRIDRPMTPLAKTVLQQSVDNIYQQFLNLVAQNRQTTSAQVNAIGQGRVWTGRAAKDLGLVDELGTLQDVIAAAAAKADLSDYEVFEIKKTLTPGEQFAKQLMGELARVTPHVNFRHSALAGVLASAEQQLEPLVELLNSGDPRSVYAHCLSCVAP
ncbi:signal peptide peptidase SppA [Aestuariicella hydrocarbonica]|uniref:Signal peptide peptidase SppA n=1 Tax=Pseudomaricurvus hydrocarbonicus TaxID=1470433 RepID=A0A9E5MG33_9GAMM|nr:signal peptide peptidase SppA [Aestuariicella hydrocarbonica]NHO64161.1 signal peptide peptidase SppA [Aestuariicella hydrocarbonica]